MALRAAALARYFERHVRLFHLAQARGKRLACKGFLPDISTSLSMLERIGELLQFKTGHAQLPPERTPTADC